jgi:endonuclease-3
MKRAQEIVRRLERWLPDATTGLSHDNPFQLLVATILSAQTTDEQVNRVTPKLFTRYKSVSDFAGADLQELRALVGGVNFYRTKAKNLKAMARMLLEKHDGRVPCDLDALIELPGVARKTANVVLGTCFKAAAGIVVDTHVHRVSQRLGLTKEDTPAKIEQDLMKVIQQGEWITFGHRMIWFGRKICRARKPLCPGCPLSDVCPYPAKTRRSELTAEERAAVSRENP